MRKVSTFLLLISIFTLFTQEMKAQGAEIDLLQQINQGAPALKPFSAFISNTTTDVSLAVPVVVGAAGLISGDEGLIKDAVYIAAASGLNLVMTQMLKHAIDRPRPYVTYPAWITPGEMLTNYSMPSGHTSGAFATATALSLSHPKWYVIVPSFAWAGYVGYSRMHLGVHYPSDVAAGALLGAGSAWVTWKANQWFWGNYEIKDWRLQKKVKYVSNNNVL